MTLFDEVKRLGIPYANHYSDLYIPDTEQTRSLLKQFPELCKPSRFTNQVEGGIWLDIPFAFIPYWETRKQEEPAL